MKVQFSFEELLPAEAQLIDALKLERPCKIGSEIPLGSHSGTHEYRCIRAGFLKSILTEPDYAKLIPERGIKVIGAWISGDLDLHRKRVPVPIHLEKCYFTGVVDFSEAEIISLCLTGSRVYQLILNGTFCSRDIVLSYGFCTNMPVLARALKVNGQLGCSGGQFAGSHLALWLEMAEVKEAFFWRRVENLNGILDLTGAKVGILIDDQRSWPDKGKLYLDGFYYSQLGSNTEHNYFERISWLERQYQPHLDFDFRPQPFEQLYKVLMLSGRDEAAKRVAVKKLDYQRRATLRRSKPKLVDLLHRRQIATNPFERAALDIAIKNEKAFSVTKSFKSIPSRVRWLASCIFGIVCGYGYRPNRCLYAGILLAAVASNIFSHAFENGTIIPKNTAIAANYLSLLEADFAPAPYAEFYNTVPSYPKFNAIAYAVDTLVPFISLGQEEHWVISTSDHSVFETSPSRWFLWIYIMLGWVLTAVFAASVTGIVRR